MPKIKYRDVTFRGPSVELIAKANEILTEYETQGFTLTLRQLYYQFVSRDLIPNTMKSYKALGSVINDARLAGLIDWSSIVDRTRGLERLSSWDHPAELLKTAAEQYHEDLWATQANRVEVWIEKDALVGVIEPVCTELDVPYLSCRGYTSQSEMWTAAMRLNRWWDAGQTPHVVHLGDHDPSGKDMTRDIEDRLTLFAERHGNDRPEVHRIALTMDQIEEYEPPPNPKKITDSRATTYIAEFGKESWELDALEPRVIADLIRDQVLELRDEGEWNVAVEKQEGNRRKLEEVRL